MSGEAIAIVGAAVGLLAVLVPLILTLHGRVVAEVGDVRRSLASDVAEVRRDLHAEATAIRADLHTLAERVARIEGAMSAWQRPPANGTPAAPSPETTA